MPSTFQIKNTSFFDQKHRENVGFLNGSGGTQYWQLGEEPLTVLEEVKKSEGSEYEKNPILPKGIILTPFSPHKDDRGCLTEVFRASNPSDIMPVQWNYIDGNAKVLRGAHVHYTHTDYLLVLKGKLCLSLLDIRKNSQTYGLASQLTLSEQQHFGVTIPTGVVHSFYFPEPTMFLYSISHYWNSEDELGCQWQDAVTDFMCPIKDPILSERDIHAGSFEQMCNDYENKI